MESSQPNSFLVIILQLPIPKTRLNSIPLLPSSYPGRLASRNSTLRFMLLHDYCSVLFYESEPESYVTTDGQSASVSWNKAPSGAYDQIFDSQTFADLLMWGALSDERTGLSFKIAAGLSSAVNLWSESRRTCDNILLSQIWDFPFRRLLRLAGLRWRYSTPPPQGICRTLLYNHFARTTQKTACWLVRCLAMDVLLLRAYACAGMCLPSRCLTMGIVKITTPEDDPISVKTCSRT
jgi:hypothetical protein